MPGHCHERLAARHMASAVTVSITPSFSSSFSSLFAMPSLAVMLAGAVASEPDLAAAPPLVPLAPPVWANAALEKSTAAAATGIKIFRIQASFVYGDALRIEIIQLPFYYSSQNI